MKFHIWTRSDPKQAVREWYQKRRDGKWHAFLVPKDNHPDVHGWRTRKATPDSLYDVYETFFISVCHRVGVFVPVDKWKGHSEPKEPICAKCARVSILQELDA